MNQEKDIVRNVSHVLSSLITEKLGKSEIVIHDEEVAENSEIEIEEIEKFGEQIAEQCTSAFNLGNQQGSENFSVWHSSNIKCFVAVKPYHSHR